MKKMNIWTLVLFIIAFLPIFSQAAQGENRNSFEKQQIDTLKTFSLML